MGVVKVNHFRARMEIILRKKGWSVTELARRLGKSQQRIYDVIQRGDPKASILRDFAVALGVSPDELLEEVTSEEYGEAFVPTFNQESK